MEQDDEPPGGRESRAPGTTPSEYRRERPLGEEDSEEDAASTAPARVLDTVPEDGSPGLVRVPSGGRQRRRRLSSGDMLRRHTSPDMRGLDYATRGGDLLPFPDQVVEENGDF